MRKMNVSMLIAAFSLAGCLGAAPTGTGTGTGTTGTGTTGSGATADPNAPAPGTLGLGPTGGTTTGGMGNTFDHDNDSVDPFAVLQRIQQEGPPAIATKEHSCEKMKYATIGNVLSGLGVNMAGTGTTAGGLYKGGASALGAPNYQARVSEALALTTAGATKLFDIFVQAAPEIIKAMPTQAGCMVAGAPTSMFATDGTCTAAGISCLSGFPATQAQIDLCNSVSSGASSATVGQTVAVATILAAAHTCE